MPTIGIAMSIAQRADAAAGLDPNESMTSLVNTLVKSLKPVYVDLIVTCIWSAMLIPLSIVLLFFSDRDMRRKPVFIGNVFAISVGISFGGIIIAQKMSMLLNPLGLPNIPLFITIVIFLVFGPFLVEAVLLMRLWAVYPRKTTPRKIFIAISIPIILLKSGRIVNGVIYLVEIYRQVKGAQSTIALLQQPWTRFPNYKIGWLLEVADNTVTATLFLAKLNRGRALRSVTGGQLASTLNSIFWIAVYNFVIPVILSIAELAVIWTTTDIFQVIPICIVNIYVGIIGVLLATVWAAGTKWQDAQKSVGSGVQISTLTETSFFGIVDMSAMSPAKKGGAL